MQAGAMTCIRKRRQQACIRCVGDHVYLRGSADTWERQSYSMFIIKMCTIEGKHMGVSGSINRQMSTTLITHFSDEVVWRCGLMITRLMISPTFFKADCEAGSV